MDAMSDAIEGADVMLYGVSLAYKESANVRHIHCDTQICALRADVTNFACRNFVSQCRLEANVSSRWRMICFRSTLNT